MFALFPARYRALADDQHLGELGLGQPEALAQRLYSRGKLHFHRVLYQ